MTANAQPLEILEDLLKRAKAKGAEAADCLIVRDISLNVAQRLGKREKLERSEAQDLGLRVFIGKRQAIVSTSDLEPKTLGRAGRARGRDGAGGAGGRILRPRRSGAAGEDAGRARSRGQDGAERGRAHRDDRARGGRGARRAGRHQFRGRGSGLGQGADRARRQQRLPRRLCDQPLGHQRFGAGGRRHRHGARLRFLQRGVWRELVRPRNAGAIGRRTDCAAPQSAQGFDREDPDRLRPARRQRPDRPFRRRHQRRVDRARHQLPQGQDGAADLRARASASSTIRTARAACAPSRSTAKASPTRSAP